MKKIYEAQVNVRYLVEDSTEEKERLVWNNILSRRLVKEGEKALLRGDILIKEVGA